MVLDLERRPDLLEAAGVEDGDTVGQLERLVLVVSDEDRGLAGALVDVAQPAPEILANLGVERAERLVEQQHARLDGQRAGEGHTLALPTRELRGIAIGELRELDEVEQIADALGDRVTRGSLGALPRPQAVADVVGHRHVLEERVVLENEADLALLHRDARRVGAAEDDAARVGALQPGDDTQQRRLTRSRWPEQCQQLAGADLEIYVLDDGNALEGLGDALDRDRRQARVNDALRRRGRRRIATPGPT